ncbi:hypothetical protein PTSG_12146 [Salpingoeca rosetta]|uniref:Uncharacterized protein n=1 Tax=Salpingoeca rosetta (strain ATCC 50818 / BSB-021) TaxID=946362 RepID=F2U736_SALR5|nr:uncharacterized protein PTSG_12146 [Salpingoeca rosetta]EGD83668.1 hypothetical protein PTSG_12146 [Salpingoeca rosetta]|eukprot:XP_004995172.1 hypothetical protein PTSG_12146 [Salpingoeca rosetta]
MADNHNNDRGGANANNNSLDIFGVVNRHANVLPDALSHSDIRSQITATKKVYGKLLTPLGLYLRNGHDNPEVVQAFLDAGASVFVKDNLDMSLLHYAAEANAHRTLELLLKQEGVEQEVDRLGTTPLDLAVKRNHHASMALLDATSLNLMRMCRAAFLREHGAKVPYVLRDTRDFPQSLKLFLNYDRPYPGFSMRITPSSKHDTHAAGFDAVAAQQHMLDVASHEFLNENRVALIKYEDAMTADGREHIRLLYRHLFDTQDFRVEQARSSRAIIFNERVVRGLFCRGEQPPSPSTPRVYTYANDDSLTQEQRQRIQQHLRRHSQPQPSGVRVMQITDAFDEVVPLALHRRRGCLQATLDPHRPTACARVYCTTNLPPLDWNQDEADMCRLLTSHANTHATVPHDHALLIDYGPFAKVTAYAFCLFVRAPAGESLQLVVEGSVVPFQGDVLTGMPRHDPSRIFWQPLLCHGIDTPAPAAQEPFTTPRAWNVWAELPDFDDADEGDDDDGGGDGDDGGGSVAFEGQALDTREEARSADDDNEWTCIVFNPRVPVRGTRLFRVRPAGEATAVSVRQFDVFGVLAHSCLFPRQRQEGDGDGDDGAAGEVLHVPPREHQGDEHVTDADVA